MPLPKWADLMAMYPSFQMAPRDDRGAIENGLALALRFNADGLIPVCVTEAGTGRALMQAWMNEDAIAQTLATGEAHYFSRSRQALWHKGATSGQVQRVIRLQVDCDQDALWMTVEQAGGGCCHVGYEDCFYRDIALEPPVEGKAPRLILKGRKIA